MRWRVILFSAALALSFIPVLVGVTLPGAASAWTLAGIAVGAAAWLLGTVLDERRNS